MRNNIEDIAKRKNSEKIVVLTAYTARVAEILDNHCDILLVGDSLGMVLYGMDSTLPVSLDMMINHGKAVTKSSTKALIVVDMPFGSYEESKELALKNAKRIIEETGCQAVKLEGGVKMAETISHLVENGITVMAHIGLMPQSVKEMGGYVVQGKDKESADNVIADAEAVEQAGAFAVVIEGVKKEVAEQIAKTSKIPTIGIGASAECDGQVLVTEDMVGINESVPKFVKQYADLSSEIDKAAENYAKDVKSKKFPGDEHCY